MRMPELFDVQVNKLLKKENGVYDLKSTTLKGLKLPVSADSAANKQYVDQVVKKYHTKEDVQSMIKELKEEINIIKTLVEKIFSHFEAKYYSKADVDKLISKQKQ